MMIAQYLNYAVFTAIKPPTIGPQFIKAIQSIRAALEPVLGNVNLNQCYSLLDALILEPSFPSPHNRLVMDEIIDVRCGDIGYLTGTVKKPQFVRLGNILDSEPFKPLALKNLDSKNGVDLEPEDVWSVSNNGQNRRYPSHKYNSMRP
jgi:hypothetical protein